MSGRFPVHIGGNQAGVCSNSLPLGAKLISDKLKGAGYELGSSRIWGMQNRVSAPGK